MLSVLLKTFESSEMEKPMDLHKNMRILQNLIRYLYEFQKRKSDFNKVLATDLVFAKE